jgi:DNA polymerase III gamma/tau subunit
MHAFLLIGSNLGKLETKGRQLASEFHARVLPFPLLKIDDVRSLNNLIRLSFSQPTLIFCPNIHEAGEEALNAFLKNLEEPQENIHFVLTAPSVRKVLPTIASRCQVIKIVSEKPQITDKESSEIQKFLHMSIGKKLSYIDKIKDRQIAIEFAENMVNFMHGTLHEKEVQYSMKAKNIDLALKTLARLKANGNVNLQLSNFVTNYAD